MQKKASEADVQALLEKHLPLTVDPDKIQSLTSQVADLKAQNKQQYLEWDSYVGQITTEALKTYAQKVAHLKRIGTRIAR